MIGKPFPEEEVADKFPVMSLVSTVEAGSLPLLNSPLFSWHRVTSVPFRCVTGTLPLRDMYT